LSIRSKKIVTYNNNDSCKTVLITLIKYYLLYYIIHMPTYMCSLLCSWSGVKFFCSSLRRNIIIFQKRFVQYFSTASRGPNINCNGFMYCTCPGTYYVLYSTHFIRFDTYSMCILFFKPTPRSQLESVD